MRTLLQNAQDPRKDDHSCFFDYIKEINFHKHDVDTWFDDPNNIFEIEEFDFKMEEELAEKLAKIAEKLVRKYLKEGFQGKKNEFFYDLMTETQTATSNSNIVIIFLPSEAKPFHYTNRNYFRIFFNVGEILIYD